MRHLTRLVVGTCISAATAGAGCGSSGPVGGKPPSTVASPEASPAAAPTGLSPYWSSLFVQGATSTWKFNHFEEGGDYNDELGECEVTTSVNHATAVLCTVTSVKREGALWSSTVACKAEDADESYEDGWPSGSWLTDGAANLWYNSASTDEPEMTDPPRIIDCSNGASRPPLSEDQLSEACNGGERLSMELSGDRWCVRLSSADGGRGRCFERGVGPAARTETGSFSPCGSLDKSLTRGD
jgi:hypothetical protein